MSANETENDVQPRILLLDDSVKTGVDGEPESALQSFAERLSNIEGFVCFAPPVLDKDGHKVRGMPVAEATDMLLDGIRRHRADAVVLDAKWWGDEWFGLKIWKNAIDSGRLGIPSSRVVFVSMYLDDSGIARYVHELGLDRRQVVYRLKGEGGLDTAAKWLKSQLGGV
jgi:hypothetical protein